MELKQIKINNELTTYFISSEGELYNQKTDTWYKGRVSESGYLDYILRWNDKQYSFRAHRLVAEYYLNNPNNLTIVNHKDGNKLNNNVSNLEWVNQSQNVNHAYSNNLINKGDIGKVFYDEDLPNEEWRRFSNYNYEVSNMGRVRNFTKKNILKGKRDTGYVRYELSLPNGKKTFLGHRLVMIVFKDMDINSKEIVNHINGDKTDNRLENLEIVDRQENSLKAYYETKTNSKTRPIIQFDLNGNYIKEWAGANRAARELKLTQNLITSACQRKGSSQGFKWLYKDEYVQE